MKIVPSLLQYFLICFAFFISLSPVHAAPSKDVRFTGKISAKEIVDKTCVVKAKQNGTLVSNSDMMVLSSLLPGGKPGKVTVTVGGANVRLVTSNNSLTRDDKLVENVSLLSGIGNMSKAVAKGIIDGTKEGEEFEDRNRAALIDQYIEASPLFKNEKIDIEIYFMASMSAHDGQQASDTVERGGNNFFVPGLYKAKTTVTCELNLE